MLEFPLAAQAEAAIRRLRDVDGVSVRCESDELTEIHVVTHSGRSAKQIVRDVQAVLRTELGLPIDHRIVSVAFTRAEDAASADPPRPEAQPGTTTSAPPSPPSDSRQTQRAAGEPAASTLPREDRIRYENVNLIVNGQRTQAQVELRWKNLSRIGNASGWSSRDDAHRLVAQATAQAVQEFLVDSVAFNVREVTFVELTGRRVAVVVLSLLAHRHEKVLTGSCTVEQDTPQAVVLATLAALNRIVAGMRVKEPTEYVLRTEAYASEG